MIYNPHVVGVDGPKEEYYGHSPDALDQYLSMEDYSSNIKISLEEEDDD
jgi:hypothetical protein